MGKNKAVSRNKALAAQDDGEQGPMRTCIATRTVQPVAELMRFALSPDAMLAPDLKAQLPGRGVWVTANSRDVTDAVKKGAFARSLKQPVKLPDDLPGLVERLLREDMRQSLSMANKAGLVVTGFSKVEAAVMNQRAIAVISANDGAEDGKRKLGQSISRSFGDRDGLLVISILESHELDLALGRENAIHAALYAGSAGDAFLKKCYRLERYLRAGSDSQVSPDAGNTQSRVSPEVDPDLDPVIETED
jgi:uncharacterized protein